MSEQQKQRPSGKIIEAIIEKLLPWHRIKWLGVGMLSQTVKIRVLDMDVSVGLCADGSYQVQFLNSANTPEDPYQIQRLEAILNGAKRDDAGNLTCGVDKGIEEPSYSVPAVVPLPDPGPGYRLLNKGEELKPGDEYWHDKDGKWEPSARANYNLTNQPGSEVYRRKIEAEKPKHVEGVWVEEADARTGRKIEPTKWKPKIGDLVRINSPGRVNHGKVGIVVDKRARTCDVASEEVSNLWKTWGLTANELQFIGFPE